MQATVLSLSLFSNFKTDKVVNLIDNIIQSKESRGLSNIHKTAAAHVPPKMHALLTTSAVSDHLIEKQVVFKTTQI